MICNEPNCGREATKRNAKCRPCRYKREKELNPEKLAYRQLKGHAKERGKEFTITFDEFKKFCVKTKYISQKGTEKDSYHLDRIDEEKGYVLGNLQLLTNSENKKKHLVWLESQNGKPNFRAVIREVPQEQKENYPF